MMHTYDAQHPRPGSCPGGRAASGTGWAAPPSARRRGRSHPPSSGAGCAAPPCAPAHRSLRGGRVTGGRAQLWGPGGGGLWRGLCMQQTQVGAFPWPAAVANSGGAQNSGPSLDSCAPFIGTCKRECVPTPSLVWGKGLNSGGSTPEVGPLRLQKTPCGGPGSAK